MKIILFIILNFVLISNTLLSKTIECNGEVMSEKKFIESDSSRMCFGAKLIMSQKEIEDSPYYESCSKKYEQLSTDTLLILCKKLELEGAFKGEVVLFEPLKYFECLGGKGDKKLYKKIKKEQILSCVNVSEFSSINAKMISHGDNEKLLKIQQDYEEKIKRINNCKCGKAGCEFLCSYNISSDNDEIDELKERIEDLERELYSLKNQ